MATILIVGAADTGRAPIAAALLRRLAAQHDLPWRVESAGVVGHDGEPAEPEARDTLAHLSLDIGDHRARTVTPELLAVADVLLAIDSGTARVLRARFPGESRLIYSLGDLAGRQRDVPDPFRMQIGAWIAYARELEALLEAALPRLRELLPGEAGGAQREHAAEDAHPELAALPAARLEAVARIDRLLDLLSEMPGVVDWPRARAQIEADLAPAGAPAEDLAIAYAALLRAALTLTPSAPAKGQAAALRAAFQRLARPIAQDDIAWLSGELKHWPTL